MAFPVAPVRLPGDLAAKVNGKLPDEILVRPGFPGRLSGRCHQHAARGWDALASEVFRLFGETLTITSSPDAYRAYVVQEWTFRDRYTRSYLAGRPYKMWDSDGDGIKERWYQRPGTAMAAVPGTSNHGWALAFDVCLWRLVDGVWKAVGIQANTAMFAWLLANAHNYGFSWEVQSEPWHLRYFYGDDVPPALRPPPIPSPSPTPTEDEVAFEGMWYQDGGPGDYAVFSDGRKLAMTSPAHYNAVMGIERLRGASEIALGPKRRFSDYAQCQSMGYVDPGPDGTIRHAGTDPWGWKP
jgi:hypothetical protein